MRPDTREIVINALMLAAAFAILTAIILIRPAARIAREPAAQSVALSAAVTRVPAHR
jgi:hypothetical protein